MKTVWPCLLLALVSVTACSRVSGAYGDSERPPAQLSEYVQFHRTWNQRVSDPAAVASRTCPRARAQDDAAATGPVAHPAACPENSTTAHPTGEGHPLDAGIPAKVAATAMPAAAKQSVKPEGIAPVSVTAGTQPTLDLKTLEARLRETSAIGVLTKLAIRNQVDDLLGQFRAYYEGRLKITLAELRRPYELLLLKVLALLQDTDPPLARAIAASREAIWDILADPARFKAV